MTNKRRFIILLISLLLSIAVFLSAEELTNSDELIRNRIETAGFPPRIEIDGQHIYASTALPLFYEKRGYFPVWIHKKKLSKNGEDLITELKKASLEGLDPDDYHLSLINKIRDENNKLSDVVLVDLDLLLTDAFLIYGTHLLSGKVDPISIDPEWFTNLKDADFISILENALVNSNVRKSLNNLLPRQEGYNRLRVALALYRRIEANGGWRSIPEGKAIKLGDTSWRVPLIRERLEITEDYDNWHSDDYLLFDEKLLEAVKIFQTRHGLDVDGSPGAKTIAAMNVPVGERIDQIRLNMERWRWLPQELGSTYIMVNIANFELDIFEDKKSVLDMKVIVGKTYRKTPVFSDQMTYLVFSPYWNIPNNIAVHDIIPMVKKDEGYLKKLGIKIFQGRGSDKEEVDPALINWAEVDSSNFSNWLRQEPGSVNLLGGVKFMFPNKFNVYLHDTPARDLFSRTARDFSSGCIRIEKPEELAVYLLKNTRNWNRDKIVEAMKSGVEQTVKLLEPIPIHILYLTAWADGKSNINFRNDIYKRDKTLLEALSQKPESDTKVSLR